MTRSVTQLKPLINLSDYRASWYTREHEGRERRTLLRMPITSVPLTGTGAVFQNVFKEFGFCHFGAIIVHKWLCLISPILMMPFCKVIKINDHILLPVY